MRLAVLALAVLMPASLFAQGQPLPAAIPSPTSSEQVTRVLAEAKLPFTEDQEQAIVLMMEDRRQASEELFGDLLDFSQGPTQGQDEDRLRSAIGWMRSEFLTQLQTFLTPEQNTVWNRFLANQTAEAAKSGSSQRQAADAVRPDQQQRLHRGRRRDTCAAAAGAARRLFERGGVGAFHGNAELMLKDDDAQRQKPARPQQAAVPGTRDQLRLRRAGHPEPADVHRVFQPQQGGERRHDPRDDPAGPVRSGHRQARDHEGNQ